MFITSSFTTSSARFNKFDVGNVIIFQIIKVFGKNIKETALARSFIKLNVRPSFARLKAIRQINRVH